MPPTTTELPTVAEVLRGDRDARPGSDRTVAAGLRADLEDRLFELLGARPADRTLTIYPGTVRNQHRSTDVTHAPTGKLRGVLVGHVLRLLVVGHVIGDAFFDALDAWRASDRESPLAAFSLQLSADELARLATDVTAHAVTLRARLGDINPRWRPRTDVSAAVRLAGGAVVLRDTYDLVVGSTTTSRASLALFDVTTSPFGPAHERVLRYHALTATLRNHVPPLRVVSLSTATGELWSCDVTDEFLRRALDELADTCERQWAA